jgi:hypothetical protein
MGRHTLSRRIAKRMNAARKVCAGGRPLSGHPRCPCGVMTLRRALARADARGKGLGHDPACSFYRERVIVV